VTVRAADDHHVAGLHVRIWPGSGPVVLGLPGLGSSGRSWSPLADALPSARVVAPDLRGRGGSAEVRGPSGLRAHARDVARLADELDLRDIVVAGHSMGAYLAPVAAEELGERVDRLVLVDGGLPPTLPFFLRHPAIVRLVFRTQVRRTQRAYPDVETFVRRAAGHALDSRPDLLPAVIEMMRDELDGPPGALRPRLDAEHVVADAVDSFCGGDVEPALDGLRVPAHVLAATGQKKDGGRPFLSDAVLAEWTRRQPLLTAERVTANHVTIMFAPELAKAVQG
jgi:pimeloyl-ACP methyl ester carboxylesterase